MHQPGIYFCNTKDMEQHRYTSENMNPAVLGFDESFYGIQEKERRNYVMQGVDCPVAKDAYLTYDDARRALRQRSVQQQKDNRIYKCDICGYWHFTTKPGSHRHRCKGYNRSRGREEMQPSGPGFPERENRKGHPSEGPPDFLQPPVRPVDGQNVGIIGQDE